MNSRKSITQNKYLKYLLDVYSGKKNEQSLARQHNIGVHIVNALEIVGYADEYGQSQMQNKPTLKDAEKVRIARRISENRNDKIKTKIAKPSLQKPTKQSREISILWGMIKIKS